MRLNVERLRAYLTAKQESISHFAGRSGLDRVWLQRLLKFNKPARISADAAKAIHLATDGHVRWDRWGEAA